MKKIRLNFQKCVAIIFVAFIVISGIFTFVKNPVKIVGGLARGYIDSPENSNILKKIGNGFSTFDTRMSEYYAFHDESINAFGLIQNSLGKTLIDDVDKESEVVKLKNSYLVFKQNSDSDFTKLKESLIELNKTCKKSNTKLLYVNKISKDTTEKNLLPDNYPYVHSSNYEELEKALNSENIQILNLESIIEKNNIDKYQLFFKTDHHWTHKTGIWVSKLICDSLNHNYKYNLNSDLFDIGNYNIETYKNTFLGSQGKRVGMYYAGVDDFDVITPKFKTNLELKIPNENIAISGDFEATMIHRESITPDNLLNKNDTAYDTYMHGNHPLVNIKNKNDTSNKKALLIMDSYGCVVAPYLSQAFATLDCIDLRSFSDSLDEYIIKTNPDVVIYMATNYQ